MNIRRMTPKDKSTIRQILHNTPEFTNAEVELAIQVINDHLSDPDESGYFILVAEIGSVVAGYVCYGPTPITEGTWDVYWIAVDRDIRERGVGTQLMEAVEANIKDAKGRLILIETSSKPGYEKTNRFYQFLDYTESCRIRDFYAIGDDRITYEKRFK
jgi:GNAT superfamily N-acetyltransferase